MSRKDETYTFHYSLNISLYPFPCIDKRLHPRGDLVVLAVSGIMCLLPREDSTLQVWHHSQMTSVAADQPSHVVVAAVGIGGIAVLVILCHDIVGVLVVGQIEIAFSVSSHDVKPRVC